MKVWIDYQDDDTESVIVEVEEIPRIGEKVGVRQPDGMGGSRHFALDYVVDVRHYLIPVHEIHVLTSSHK